MTPFFMSRRALFAVAFLSVAALIYFGCSHRQSPDTSARPGGGDAFTMDESLPEGLRLTLRETHPPDRATSASRTVEGEALSDAAREAIFARLDALPDAARAQAEFALRATSKPAPRTENTQQKTFPPDAEEGAAPAQTSKDFRLLRYQPEGDVDLAPKISLTFSEAVVPLTGHQDAAHTVPASLSPAVDGQWRWIETQTALFEPDAQRFPMATTFRVTPDKNLTSTNGTPLQDATSWTFSTPTVRIENAYPTGSGNVRQPLIFLSFNQKIDIDAVLESLEIRSGSSSYPFEKATTDEIQKDETVKNLVDRAQKDRWIAVRPVQELPAASNITVILRAGTPSAEGPLKTTEEQKRSFKTFDALRVSSQSCESAHPCPPGGQLMVWFNNRLDEDAFSKDLVRIEPAVKNLEVDVRYSGIHLRGEFKARTTYTLHLNAALQDVHGQKLGKDTTVTFHMGEAPAQLGSFGDLLTVLDPALEGTYPFFRQNYRHFRVRAWSVQPEQWPDYLQLVLARNNRYITDMEGNPTQDTPNALKKLGKPVIDEALELKEKPDEMVDEFIDLQRALNDEGHGHVVLWIELDPKDPSKESAQSRGYRPYIPEILTWVQVTDLALHRMIDPTQLLAWTSDLATGAPIEGAEIRVQGHDVPSQITDANGLARLELSPNDAKVRAKETLLVARRGSDSAFLPEQNYAYSNNREQSQWIVRTPAQELLWHVIDDRGMYQPGERVHIKGWVRNARTQRDSTLSIPNQKVHYIVYDARRNVLAEEDLTPDAHGAFEFTIDLEDDVNLGYATVEFRAEDDKTTRAHHRFNIQEFRRPEFEVSVDKTDGPYIVDNDATFSAHAQYYAGGGLNAAPIYWTLTQNEAHYAPPNQTDYTFGRWNPWWWWGTPRRSSADPITFESETDAEGKHHLFARFDGTNPPLPTQLEASAAVEDVQRQRWQGKTSLLVHPSDRYVGLKTEKNYVPHNESFRIDALVTDIDGKPAEGHRVQLTASRLEWTFRNGGYEETVAESQTCDVQSTLDAQTCVFKPKKTGTWRVRAIVYDDQDRPNMSELRVWVGTQNQPPNRRAQQEDVRIIPDKEHYAVGDDANLLFLAPFPNAEALVTVRQAGVVREERFRFEGDAHTWTLPIQEKDSPNVIVHVDLVSDTARDDAPSATRPAWAVGEISLSVPPTRKTLALEIEPHADQLAPGDQSRVRVTVRDADKKIVRGAQVTLFAVDEAILALSNYALADPLDTFYRVMQSGVQDAQLHTLLILALGKDALDGDQHGDAEEESMMDAAGGFGGISAGAAAPKMMMRQSAVMEEASMDNAAPGQAPQAIDVRTNFNPLAVFVGHATTDADGHADVTFDLPDNLTRYRVMAIASHDAEYFGTGEKNITARLPLMVRTSAPRFLNYGDRFELPVVLQNQTDEDMDVQVAVRATNLRLGNNAGRSVRVPANDRVEVRFDAAADKPGVAHIQVAAVSGDAADASMHTLPVWTPATTEAFATYGTIDDDGDVLTQPVVAPSDATYGTIDDDGDVLTQPVVAPSDAIAEFGSLDVTTSSSAVQSLTDALLYLTNYPFFNTEHNASRILGSLALKDVLSAFESEGLPSDEDLQEALQKDVDRIVKLQRPDGGFYLWSTREVHRFPFAEVHAAHALARAEKAGLTVDTAVQKRTAEFLTKVDSYLPDFYGEVAKNSVRAYAFYVRSILGHDVVKDARALSQKEPNKELSLEAISWLMRVLKDDKASQSRIQEFVRYVENRVDETASTAQFTDAYEDDAYVLMHSSRRTDALLLQAWMDVVPQSDLIVKVVRGLQAHQKRGHWSGTQENVFVLLALEQYFKTYEKQVPDFVANLWVGEQFAGDHRFKGREIDQQNTSIPMTYLTQESGNHTGLTLQKKGKGRLYYRLAMQYALASLDLDPAEHGFSVSRRYEALDDDNDVHQNDDGTWSVALGARLRVRVQMVAPARRYHVALVDPLPAAFEAINSELAVSEKLPESEQKHEVRPFWWGFSRWYEHENLRDERAEVFSSLVPAGVYEYTYIVRATTPGTFIVPPAKAEEMYAPETFARTGTDRVIVK